MVAINRFGDDSDAELDAIHQHCAAKGVLSAVSDVYARGGAGGAELAQHILTTLECNPAPTPTFIYDLEDAPDVKMRKIVQKVYGGKDVVIENKAKNQLKKIADMGFGHLPICMAKTQYSFSTNPDLKGAPSGHVVLVRELRLSAGAEFVIVVTGEIMTMPGLPRVPSADSIHLNKNGRIEGLF